MYRKLAFVLLCQTLCLAGTPTAKPRPISYKQMLHALPKTLKESERRRADDGAWACYLNFSDYIEGGMPTAFVMIDSKQFVYSFDYAFHYRWDKKPELDRQKSVELIVSTLRLVCPQWREPTQWLQAAIESVWNTGETAEHREGDLVVISIKRDFSESGPSPYDNLQCEIHFP